MAVQRWFAPLVCTRLLSLGFAKHVPHHSVCVCRTRSQCHVWPLCEVAEVKSIRICLSPVVHIHIVECKQVRCAKRSHCRHGNRSVEEKCHFSKSPAQHHLRRPMRCLSSLVSIHARNLSKPTVGNAPDSTTVTSYCVALRWPCEPPFFVTPPSEPASHATWGECSSAPIRPSHAFAKWARDRGALSEHAVLVSLWSESVPQPEGAAGPSTSAWRCVWELPVDLASTASCSPTCSPPNLKEQSCIVHLGLALGVSDQILVYVPVGPQVTTACHVPHTSGSLSPSYAWIDAERYVYYCGH